MCPRDDDGHTVIERALRESEERNRLIIEGAHDYAIITMSADGIIESWSPGAEVAFQWPKEKIVGQPFAVTFTEEDQRKGVPELELEIAREKGVAPDVRWHRRMDNTTVFIEGTTRVLKDSDGIVRGFLKTGQDVTRRREVDEALRSGEARYRTLVENIHDYAICLLDAKGLVTEWAKGAEGVMGYESTEAVGRHVSIFYTPEALAADEPARDIVEATKTGRVEREAWRVRKDGTRFWANEIMTAIRDADGTLVGFTKITRDLTDRRLAEEANERTRLDAERNTMRQLLASAEEEERRRLARELHDQLGQHLAALALGLAEARHLIDRGQPVDARLNVLEELAQVMTRDARYLALELRPPELDDVGLISALQTYVEQWTERFHVPADFASTGETETVIPDNIGTALYRITQEALTNVAKHAEAKSVSVILEMLEEEIRLIVEDDGIGFEMESTLARTRAERRLGLAGMNERAALAGGTVTVESTPGGGTTIFVRLPVDHTEKVKRA